MADFPEAGVRLVAETDEANSAIDELAGNLDSITSSSYTVTVDTEVDTSGLDSADIPTEDDTVTTTVDVEETDTAKASLDALNFLKNTKIIETVWNIAGTAVNLFQQFGGQILQPMIDLDGAVARVNATTGEAIPNARTLIKDIFYDDLGESINQVGELISHAHQIGAPLDEATRSALTFTHTFTDQNPQTVLDTLNQMVVNKLTPDFKTAGDVLVTAFQNGANRGGDLLQALNDNANAIHNMGLTGPEALSFIKTGLDNGFNSAQQVIQALEKIKQNVTNAAGNPTSDVSKTLDILGIANPAETGEAWSADFFKKVIEGIKNQPGLSDSEKEVLFTNLIGGKQGGKTFSAFLAMSPDEADTIFANVGGAAERAAKDADDSIQGAIDDFRLAVEKGVQDWLSSDAIDLPGKIAALKTGLQNALDTLTKGGSLGEALTVALKPIGFDDEFQGLEAALGNFVIGILQAVAQLQTLTGHGAEAESTQFTIHQLARQQLAFDLKIANPDEIAGVIKTATERGLDPAQIAGSISTAVDELVKSGSPEAAQAIIDSAKTAVGSITFDVQGELSRKVLESQGQNPTFSVPVTPEMTPEDIQKTIDDTKAQFQAQGFFLDAAVTPSVDQATIDDLQAKVNDAFKELHPTMEAAQKSITDASKPLTDMANSTTDVTTKANDSKPKLDALAQGVDKLGGKSKITADAVADTSVSIEDTGLSAVAATVQMQGFGNAIDEITNKVGALNAAADSVAQKQGSGGAANPDAKGPNAAGTDSISGTFSVGEQGRELVTTNRDLAVLNNMTTEAIMAALSGYVAGGAAFGRGGGNSFTAINNNVVQSEAQADALGYTTAAQLRGMAGG